MPGTHGTSGSAPVLVGTRGSTPSMSGAVARSPRGGAEQPSAGAIRPPVHRGWAPATGAKPSPPPIAAAASSGAAYLIIVFMVSIVARQQSRVVTADTHSSLQIAGMRVQTGWEFMPICRLPVELPLGFRLGSRSATEDDSQHRPWHGLMPKSGTRQCFGRHGQETTSCTLQVNWDRHVAVAPISPWPRCSATSASRSRSKRRPRCSRDTTVPIGVSMIWAISL